MGETLSDVSYIFGQFELNSCQKENFFIISFITKKYLLYPIQQLSLRGNLFKVALRSGEQGALKQTRIFLQNSAFSRMSQKMYGFVLKKFQKGIFLGIFPCFKSKNISWCSSGRNLNNKGFSFTRKWIAAQPGSPNAGRGGKPIYKRTTIPKYKLYHPHFHNSRRKICRIHHLQFQNISKITKNKKHCEYHT